MMTVADLLRKDTDDDQVAPPEMATRLSAFKEAVASLSSEAASIESKYHASLSDEEREMLEKLGLSLQKSVRVLGRRSLTKARGSGDPRRDAQDRLDQKTARMNEINDGKSASQAERKSLVKDISQLEVALEEYGG